MKNKRTVVVRNIFQILQFELSELSSAKYRWILTNRSGVPLQRGKQMLYKMNLDRIFIQMCFRLLTLFVKMSIMFAFVGDHIR